MLHLTLDASCNTVFCNDRIFFVRWMDSLIATYGAIPFLPLWAHAVHNIPYVSLKMGLSISPEAICASYSICLEVHFTAEYRSCSFEVMFVCDSNHTSPTPVSTFIGTSEGYLPPLGGALLPYLQSIIIIRSWR